MTDPRDESLSGQASSSVGWLTAQTWIARIGGFVTVMILARLLTPEDFGVVAVALTVLPIVYLIADFGFGTYLMQSEKVNQLMVSTAFWYAATAGVALTIIVCVSAPAIESAFGITGASEVLIGISPAVLLVSMASVPIALLRRDMSFRLLSLQAGLAALIGQITALALAFTGFGVWALVSQTCVAQAVTLVAAWLAARWRPRLEFSLSELREMIGFGSHVVGVEAVGIIRKVIENLIISNALGGAALGQLVIAQRLVQTAQDLTGSAITPVSTVVFSRIRDDGNRLRSAYDRALGLSYFLISPALIAVVVTAPQLIPLLFGPQWTESVAPAQALAVAAIFVMGATLDHGLFYGLGRPGRWFAYAVFIDMVTIGTTAFMVRFGLSGVAMGFVAVAALATAVRWILVARAIGTTVWAVARRTLSVMVTASGAGAAGWAVTTIDSQALPLLVEICLGGIVVLSTHLVLSWIFSRAALVEVRAQFNARVET